MAKKRIVVRVNQYGKDMEIRVPGHWAEQGQEVTITVRRFGHEFRMLSHARGTCYWRKVTAHQDILRNMGVQDGDRVVILNGPVRPDILFVGTREGRHLLRVAPVARELELGGGEGLYHVEVRQLTVCGREASKRVIPKVRHAFGELRPGKVFTLPFREPGLYQVRLADKLDADWVFERYLKLQGSPKFLHLTREETGRWKIKGTELHFQGQKSIGAKRIVLATSTIDNRGHALAIRAKLDDEGELAIDLRYSTGLSRGDSNWTEVEMFKVLHLGPSGPHCIMIRYRTWGGSSQAFFKYSGEEYVKAFFNLHQVGDAILQFIEEAYEGVNICTLQRGTHQTRATLRRVHPADRVAGAWGLSDTREIGAMAVMIFRKLIEKSYVLRSAFGIKEGWEVEVDEQGLNAGDRYFDVFVNSEGGVIWLGEVKSRWRRVSDPNLSLSSALSEAVPATIRRVRDVEGKVKIVPNLGYAIGMYITEDEVLMRWTTVDLTSRSDSPLVAAKDTMTELRYREKAPTLREKPRNSTA